jgi:5-methylcytosine-specific restriction endonuclease McrA
VTERRVWLLSEDRVPLSRKQKAELFMRQDGKCPQCGQKLHIKGHEGVTIIDEHVNPLWRGGANDLANRELWCSKCASEKTAQEAAQRGKTLRQRDGHIGAKPASKRPMPGGKASGWKCRLGPNGKEWVKR